jgi:hypothetical protein
MLDFSFLSRINIPKEEWDTVCTSMIAFIEYTGNKLEELEKRIKELEEREPTIINNNYYNLPAQPTAPVWPQPQPSWPGYPYTTWTCGGKIQNGT